MTWDADIVHRAGRLSVVGQFKLTDTGEAAKFIERVNELLRIANLNPRHIVEMPAPSSPPPKVEQKVKPSPKPARILKLKPPKTRSTHAEEFSKDLPPSVRLGGRQAQIHHLLKMGRTLSQVAELTGVTPSNVSAHLAIIRKKIREAAK